MRRHLTAPALAVVLMLAGCGSSDMADEVSPTPTETPSPTPSVAMVEVPDLVGLKPTIATAQATAKGMESSITITPTSCPGYDADDIAAVAKVDRQTPAAGDQVPKHSRVTLHASTDCAMVAEAVAAAEAEAARVAEAEEAARVEGACQAARQSRDRFAVDPDIADAWMVTLVLKPAEELADLAKCPDLAADVEQSHRMITNGSYVVGVDIPAGTYTTYVGRLEDCYWERSSGSGSIIANDFVTFAPDPISVTVQDGEGFTADGCGLWVAPAPVR